uniref:FBA_2 domain-containing protein n=1 Tax=Steinernema glaseri TaxID=37863 RepID=A0A1I7Z6F7_9BILA
MGWVGFSLRTHLLCHTFRNDVQPLFKVTTTMDAVPLKFVDSVAELFDGQTLKQLTKEVIHPLWKSVIDVHHRNRVYFRMNLEWTEHGIKHAFFKDDHRDTRVSLETIRRNARFARIIEISDTPLRHFSWWKDIDPLGEAEAEKVLEKVAPQIDQSSYLFWFFDLPNSQKVVLAALFNKAYFSVVELSYCGQISYDFLEFQINNAPFLRSITLGERWPQSVLSLLAIFCLNGKPGTAPAVRLHRSSDLVIDRGYMENFLDCWKTNGMLHMYFLCPNEMVDEEGRRALMGKGVVTEYETGRLCSVLKHETEKSIAVCYPQNCEDYLLNFYTCECHLNPHNTVFERCQLGYYFPEFHNF